MVDFEDRIKNLDIEDFTFATGKVFVITGPFQYTRSIYEDYITNMGGIVAKTVTKNTDYLLTNDTESGSIKNKRAKELGIPVLSEMEFINLCQKKGN